MAKQSNITKKIKGTASQPDLKERLKDTAKQLQEIKKDMKQKFQALKAEHEAALIEIKGSAYYAGVHDALEEVARKGSAKAKTLITAEQQFEKQYTSKLSERINTLTKKDTHAQNGVTPRLKKSSAKKRTKQRQPLTHKKAMITSSNSMAEAA